VSRHQGCFFFIFSSGAFQKANPRKKPLSAEYEYCVLLLRSVLLSCWVGRVGSDSYQLGVEFLCDLAKGFAHVLNDYNCLFLHGDGSKFALF